MIFYYRTAFFVDAMSKMVEASNDVQMQMRTK